MSNHIVYFKSPKWVDNEVYQTQLKFVFDHLEVKYDLFEDKNVTIPNDQKLLKKIITEIAPKHSTTIIHTYNLSTLFTGNLISVVEGLLLLEKSNIMIDCKGTTMDTFHDFIASLSKYHYQWISEGKLLGARRAKVTGQKLGRPLMNINIEEVKKFRSKGWTLTRIAKEIGCSKDTIKNKMKLHNVEVI